MEGRFKGRWYRSSVKLEGETIVPIPPFEPYDPFDFYYPGRHDEAGAKITVLGVHGLSRKRPG